MVNFLQDSNGKETPDFPCSSLCGYVLGCCQRLAGYSSVITLAPICWRSQSWIIYRLCYVSDHFILFLKAAVLSRLHKYAHMNYTWGNKSGRGDNQCKYKPQDVTLGVWMACCCSFLIAYLDESGRNYSATPTYTLSSLHFLSIGLIHEEHLCYIKMSDLVHQYNWINLSCFLDFNLRYWRICIYYYWLTTRTHLQTPERSNLIPAVCQLFWKPGKCLTS